MYVTNRHHLHHPGLHHHPHHLHYLVLHLRMQIYIFPEYFQLTATATDFQELCLFLTITSKIWIRINCDKLNNTNKYCYFRFISNHARTSRTSFICLYLLLSDPSFNYRSWCWYNWTGTFNTYLRHINTIILTKQILSNYTLWYWLKDNNIFSILYNINDNPTANVVTTKIYKHMNDSVKIIFRQTRDLKKCKFLLTKIMDIYSGVHQY